MPSGTPKDTPYVLRTTLLKIRKESGGGKEDCHSSLEML